MEETKHIELYCREENKTIGSMALPPGGRSVDAEFVWRNFIPAATEYRLPSTRPKDGEYLLCPKCFGKLELVGVRIVQRTNEKLGENLPQPMPRDHVRRKIADDMAGKFDEHLTAVVPEGHPFILGSVKVGR